MEIKFYTDGAASNNGKENAVGGWAWIGFSGEWDIDNHDFDYGKQIGATNQQMELTAILNACNYIDTIGYNEDDIITIYSDSAYIINCYNQHWWSNWEKNGWKNAKKEPVANRDLWERLLPFFKNTQFKFIKVKGHANDEINIIVDNLAVKARLS